jgi:hypothetical protein
MSRLQPASNRDAANTPSKVGMAIARFRAALITIQTAELERLHDRLSKLNDESREEIRQFSDDSSPTCSPLQSNP